MAYPNMLASGTSATMTARSTLTSVDVINPRRSEMSAPDRTLMGRGHFNLDLHDRLEQDRSGLQKRVAKRRPRADLERQVGRVDRVTAAVHKCHLDLDDLKPGERTLRPGHLEALVHRRDVLGRDSTAGHLALELILLLVHGGQGRERADDMGVLAGSAGLLLVLVVKRDLLGRGFAVVDLRRARLDVGFVLPPRPLQVDVKVKLAHAGDDRLVRLIVVGGSGRSDLPS